MKYFETSIFEYDGMTAIEKLNYFRNLYYAEGNNTEKGIIANALNEILSQYAKEEQKKEQENIIDGKIICQIIKKSRVLFEMYGYVDIAHGVASVSYREEENGKHYLDYITLESRNSDKIIISSSSAILMAKDREYRVLCKYNGWNELLAKKTI